MRGPSDLRVPFPVSGRDGVFRQVGRDSGAACIVAVGDLSRPATVRALPAWIDAAQSVAGVIPVILLGNKVDLGPDPEADASLRELADSLGAWAFRTSAKAGTNVEDAFRAVALAVASEAFRPVRGDVGLGPVPEESP